MQTTIFKDLSAGGEVWRYEDGNYDLRTNGSSFSLCVAMAREIERLRAVNAELSESLEDLMQMVDERDGVIELAAARTALIRAKEQP